MEDKKKELVIRKVLKNKSNETKFVIIPKNENNIKEGDYVKIEKIDG